MKIRSHVLLLVITGLLAAQRTAQAAGEDSADQPRDCWMKMPTVSVMTGFIYEPLEPYTIQQWMENLGIEFDADQWVKDFKETGATHLVFYDKWIDGLVFHDTKTTDFKTKRDFVRELAAACQRQELPLIFYFNAISDGNPEFDEWSTLDKQGKPIVFSPRWPTRYQTLHSPFHQKAVEQVRELLTNYGPIHGIWHDIFHERLNTSSPWVAKGYEEMFGEPFEKASPARLAEFNARTLAGYLDEIDVIRREQGQTACIYTANGSGSSFLPAGIWTDLVGSRLQYLFNEGHGFARNDQLARMAWVLPKPLDINFKLGSSWFSPLGDVPPPSHLTDKQAIAGTAIVICQGAGVHWALTPGHSGTFGEDLERAKAAGAWFRQVKPYVKDARPYADVAIVVGTPAAGGPGLPGANPFWSRYQGVQQGAWQSAVTISDALLRRGVFSRLLYMSAQGGSWPAALDEYRAVIVPELAVLDQTHLDQLREYAKGGGHLIAFGHASLLDEKAQRREAYGLSDLYGVRWTGEVAFPADSQKATIKVDSEYNEAFGANVLAGGPGEAWASGGTPMPHWIELTLPKRVDAARVEVVNRHGPYQIADVEIEAFEGDEWKQIASVQGASTREIVMPLTPPVQVEKLRVKILKELFQGEDRQYADVRAVRVVDTKGRDWAGGSAARIPLVFDDPDMGRAFGDPPVAWAPMAVSVEPTTAKIVAHLQAKGPAAAILSNRFGEGKAHLFTTSDGAFRIEHPFWSGLARLAATEPTLVVNPEDQRRYRFIMTRSANAHVLHVIDSQTDSPNNPPRQVSVSLLSARLGDPASATQVGTDEPLTLSRDGGRISLVVQPDPVATILLK
ncbi:MAG: alpha-L-fucosidase [Planctomycetes bacterium]|nr:alpha-L-fucosidase [Planctomycetota bacterium]MBL7038038.1 alpha-L-fucosidase [Pirellulaceae bacterium]